MCGIAGFLAPPGVRADPAVLERMVTALRHRGPDAVGHHVEGRLALGVARLRIIDLATGDQPLANEDGSVRVVLNGEIYNFQALRERLAGLGHRFASRSDTEVIAHAWEEYGEACPEELNGMFGLALWDRRRQTLFLARDRMGEKPLYFASPGGWLVFGSELRAVLVHPAVSRELDPAALTRYLTYDFVPDPHTMIRGVRKLPPAHALSVADGKLAVSRYWEIPYRPDVRVDEAEWASRIAGALDEAVRSRLLSDVPVGCLLSGGIDSTAITATAARLVPDLKTFAVGYAEPRHDERPWARRAASALGTDHADLLVGPADVADVLPRLGTLLDEPIADMAFVPLYLLSRFARGSVTVALTGDGGDELFGGYPAMAAEWWHGAFARLPRPARTVLAAVGARAALLPDPLREFLQGLGYREAARNQALLGGQPVARQARLLSADMRAALAEVDPYQDVEAALAGCASDDPTARIIHRYCKLYLAGQNLANADRASMAVGLELRAPFLDHRFVELTGRIPARLRLQGLGRLKRLLKRALADRLPPAILSRGKQGFGVPLGVWFRGPLAAPLRDALAPSRLDAAGLFDAPAIDRLVDEHVTGRRDHARLLWALLVFELWREAHLT
jgi:asparagine synthase (glutamine-hydrolysing)